MIPISLLCKRRQIAKHEVDTPILIPSFSSKGFPVVQAIWDNIHQYLPDTVLISSYDLYYNKINSKLDAPNLLFVDSGGYEARKDFDLSEIYADEYRPQTWTRQMHAEGISRLNTFSSLVLISYDEIANGQPISSQAQYAEDFFSCYPEVATNFLIKPSCSDQLDIDELEASISSFHNFDIIGVTEKELGTSLRIRLLNLIKFRKALSKNNIEVPIHIFGCLDPLSVWLFYICGADIFDGLTWLRFAYHENQALYRNSWAILKQQTDIEEGDLKNLSWIENLRYLSRQRLKMIRFVQGHNSLEIPFEYNLLNNILDSVGVGQEVEEM